MKKSKEEIQNRINELGVEAKQLYKELELIENEEKLNSSKGYIGKWVKYKTGTSLTYFFVKDEKLNRYDELTFIGFGLDYFKDTVRFLGSKEFDFSLCIEYSEGLEIVDPNEYNFVVQEFLNYIKKEVVEFIKEKL